MYVRLAPVVALAIASSAARADTPADTPSDARDDHRGFIGSAALSFGKFRHYSSSRTSGGVDASLGWGVTPRVAFLARGAVQLDDKDGIAELGLAARAWPWLEKVPWLSLQLQVGLGDFHQPHECEAFSPPCHQGENLGLAVGAGVRAAVVRGRHVSLDLALTHDEVRTAEDLPRFGATMLSIGFSVY